MNANMQKHALGFEGKLKRVHLKWDHSLVVRKVHDKTLKLRNPLLQMFDVLK